MGGLKILGLLSPKPSDPRLPDIVVYFLIIKYPSHQEAIFKCLVWLCHSMTHALKNYLSTFQK
ncbi:hypothetical protein E2C01_056231 [Portunus trituberculatus]|uniref:Uncharacterized protein n=1 Tax=Portunus trituberculatus TaxID=210409 RepID=A0A5B7GZ16_PORTR|nr:hypothetical protein [Portunus trituberculatus]